MKKINIETADLKNNLEKETIENQVILKEWHSVKYLKLLKETTYKGKKVVFILPDGKEFRL